VVHPVVGSWPSTEHTISGRSSSPIAKYTLDVGEGSLDVCKGSLDVGEGSLDVGEGSPFPKTVDMSVL
jgi:hypothetical protein